ncbi:MAG: S41 family peptidase [Flavobacteriales bacterium TMED84]|nr:MAG: S41 family peptidase [Flavobacteriales bacterium TMED84]|tara:strand:+ start:8164 stop:9804 length:1641 start_codon:yes stop_codon:yes gene_type:complete
MKKKLIFISLFVSSLTLLSFKSDYFEIAKNLEIFTDLYKELNTYYVDETDPGKLIKSAMDEMLQTLDPYTNYIPESEIEDFQFMTTGQYGGIGAMITKRGEYVYISEPYEGFPAQKSGLMAGDKILEVNKISVKGKSTEEVSKLLKGQPNTNVSILVERKYINEPFEVSFKREKVTVGSVPYFGLLENNVGYVKLRSFTRNCSNDLKNAILKLKEQSATSLILDLRGNPGGLLNESVKIANFFVNQGEDIVSTKGKIKSWEKVYTATSKPIDTKIPLVVLIDQSSASASEIVSGSLQDLDRAVIVGKRSFGKGLVQQTRKLSYNSQLKLTVAKYYIPSGRCIQALDYSNRNEDGSVGKIADSLSTEFRTKNNRKVYDGGGITPDLVTESETSSKILLSLFRERLFFDYATEFRLKNENILSAKDFKITDENFLDFKSFLSDKDYEYETDTEKAYKKLKKVAKDENYFESMRNDFDLLVNKIDDAKSDDLEKNKDFISEILANEIVSRYYYQKGRIQSSLNYDKDILQAMSVLSDSTKYKQILSNID